VSDAATPPGPGLLAPSFRDIWRALGVQRRVLVALFIRESGMRRGQAYGLGWLLGAVEPLLIIGVVGTLFSITNHAPAYGSSMLLFVGTGVFPMYIFLYTSIRVREPVALAHAGRYPAELPLDEIAVHAALHLIATLIVAFAFFGGLVLMGVRDAAPSDVPTLIASSATLFLFGVGMGVVNAAVARIVPFWSIIWAALVRILFHFSGLYFVVDYFSPPARSVFELNPLTHGLNWFRHAFYPFYADTASDSHFVMACALGALFFGLTSERVLRREYLRGERHQ
jgi:capsular polysaccharide transport system permease protein